ncbi:MAG: phosphate ABC transporter permease PstA [Planctomycetes bacterium]|nr:phosphate ABC transporter permease PstA [Planctomycetota bacterium]
MKPLLKPAILVDPELIAKRQIPLEKRHRKDRLFQRGCQIIAFTSALVLAGLMTAIFVEGIGTLNANFLKAPADPDPAIAGMYPALMGSIWLLVLTMIIALPLGVAAAIVLEEFQPRRAGLLRLHGFIQLNITNLSGVPSVVFGILGLTVFVSMFGVFGNEQAPMVEVGATYTDQFFNEGDFVLEVPLAGPLDPETVPSAGMSVFTYEGKKIQLNLLDDDAPWPTQPELAMRSLRSWDLPGRNKERSWWYSRLPFGRGILAGALTLMLVILPIIIIAAQEALRAVPSSLRNAALGLGATRLQTVRQVTLPAALPGILTGAIIAMSRAIGEAAPILMIAGIVFITRAPANLMDDFTAMPLQIYNWAGRPQAEFHDLAASGIIVLLTALLGFNAIAIFLRQKLQKPLT